MAKIYLVIPSQRFEIADQELIEEYDLGLDLDDYDYIEEQLDWVISDRLTSLDYEIEVGIMEYPITEIVSEGELTIPYYISRYEYEHGSVYYDVHCELFESDEYFDSEAKAILWIESKGL